ncbi:MAG: hypothetical protein B7Z59_05750 [Acidiphilium sp. 37-67-22]|uniref:hypothetical protein n=1 Tax=unclassified Acidiphilium TaxID=2617493 RepID=UPI000BCB4651|nr:MULTISPECIES: hypothetical protein [unclassified Acidiphilium]OYV86498.1 MAG: hypothetical protein B7Z64_03385 [Acidiphilium sp. 21-68-69]OYW10949.1 MAG: hypothetical protein B7Z59_05750 [Acidiphilium sp. 37-67-22]OYV57603.1 MAG: hypothetical protein B7Z76_00070 [Acidiphilium sp. 20-67-58]HQT61994.1 hypothetical protein [Acidiphilium sp.]HQU11588.1 hypothetical protein [Acidiphilium sp.]
MQHQATEAQILEAGQVIDQLVHRMVEKEIPTIAIASALLGGALNLLGAELPDEAILRILDNAMQSVRSGALRELDEPRQ